MGTTFYPIINPHTYSPYPSSSPSDYDTKSWMNGTLNNSESARTSLSLNAPIQQRTYLAPSLTSRKTVPARFAKHCNTRRDKHLASNYSDSTDEPKQGSSSPPPLDPHLMQQIKERRRRNAISARKSRQKRLEQMDELEKERNNLLDLVHSYRDHVLHLHAILEIRGIPYTRPAFMRVN